MSTEELQDPRRARRRAGHPRGRGGADDPRGHRARRPARPRGHGPAHRDGHPRRDRRHDGAGDRRRHRRGPQPDPGLRGDDRRDRRHPLRQGPAAVPQGFGRAAAEPAVDPADAGLRARVDERGRPPPRVPAAQGPHRDRARRVRRDGRSGHHRGPARGDRRRDPGRVRRGGAAHRAAVRRRGADRRPRRRRRPGRAVRHEPRARGRRRVRHRRRADLSPAGHASRSRAT